MGHKGLGKFAPFGIADVVQVRTVKAGKRTVFEMDYRDMVPSRGTAKEEFVKEYGPRTIEAEVEAQDEAGSTLVLTSLRLKRNPSEDVFRQAMTRRFTCIGDGFTIHINGVRLPPFSIELELRIPSTGTMEETVDGETVRWWVGFTPAPIAVDELRGISVMARGKLAQNPFFFHLTKGTTGQHGLQYMTGVVEADFLDDEEDLIATDRGSVLWEHPKAASLLEWGRDRVREWLNQWNDRRSDMRLARLESERPALKGILDSLQAYPPRERDQLGSIVKRLATTVENDDQLEWAVSSIEGAYQDRSTGAMGVLREAERVDGPPGKRFSLTEVPAVRPSSSEPCCERAHDDRGQDGRRPRVAGGQAALGTRIGSARCSGSRNTKSKGMSGPGSPASPRGGATGRGRWPRMP
jgi:hypothetical protein